MKMRNLHNPQDSIQEVQLSAQPVRKSDIPIVNTDSPQYVSNDMGIVQGGDKSQQLFYNLHKKNNKYLEYYIDFTFTTIKQRIVILLPFAVYCLRVQNTGVDLSFNYDTVDNPNDGGNAAPYELARNVLNENNIFLASGETLTFDLYIQNQIQVVCATNAAFPAVATALIRMLG